MIRSKPLKIKTTGPENEVNSLLSKSQRAAIIEGDIIDINIGVIIFPPPRQILKNGMTIKPLNLPCEVLNKIESIQISVSDRPGHDMGIIAEQVNVNSAL